MKKDFYNQTPAHWQNWVKEQNLPSFRAVQIYNWSRRGINSVSDLTDLPLPLRHKLDGEYRLANLVMEDRLESAVDQTVKYVFLLADGNRIESVLMRYKYGNAVCLSTQAGCLMGCAFCASSFAGFGRNLTAGEMLAQVGLIARDSKERVSNVTLMGIGEPLANYEQTVLFLRLVNDPEGLAIGARHLTLSTCGLIPEMLEFAKEGLPVTLSISLHAPNDSIRRRLMPIAKRYDLEQLLAASREYVRLTGRRITFEYALIAGVNDGAKQAQELAARLHGLNCHLNLIAVNEVPDSDFRRSDPATMRRFQSVLEQCGIAVTVRRELGSDIAAACGQLRRRKDLCPT